MIFYISSCLLRFANSCLFRRMTTVTFIQGFIIHPPNMIIDLRLEVLMKTYHFLETRFDDRDNRSLTSMIQYRSLSGWSAH